MRLHVDHCASLCCIAATVITREQDISFSSLSNSIADINRDGSIQNSFITEVEKCQTKELRRQTWRDKR